MTSPVVVGVIGAGAILVSVLRLVAGSRLRVRYASLWLAVSTAMVVVAAAPGLLEGVSRALGFEVAANLLFFSGMVLLLLVGLHLSVAVTRLEDQVQRLAEEIALVRMATSPTADAIGAAATGPAQPTGQPGDGPPQPRGPARTASSARQ